jgi:uncharacterized protein
MNQPNHDGSGLDWLITDFTERVTGVAHAIVVSADGVLLAKSDGIPSEPATQLALITCGLSGLGRAAAEAFEGGAPTQALVDMQRGLMLVRVVSDGASLAVLAASACDMGLVAHETTLLVEALGEALTPRTRAGSLPHEAQDRCCEGAACGYEEAIASSHRARARVP